MNNFNDYLQHHGVKGMKWGVRKYRNTDGGLTPQGKRRYSREEKREIRKFRKNEYNKAFNEEFNRRGGGMKAVAAVSSTALLNTIGMRNPFMFYSTLRTNLRYISTVHASDVHGRSEASKKVTERYGKKIARDLNKEDNIKGVIFAVGAGLVGAALLNQYTTKQRDRRMNDRINRDTNWGFRP